MEGNDDKLSKSLSITTTKDKTKLEEGNGSTYGNLFQNKYPLNEIYEFSDSYQKFKYELTRIHYLNC